MTRRDSGTAFGQIAEALSLVTHGQPGHIVDTLIAERGTRIAHHPLWPVMRPFLYTVLNYRRAKAFADAVANVPGFQAFEFLSQTLQLDIAVKHGERLPAQGGFLMVSNHPTGIADGLAVYDAIKRVRGDAIFFANADALRVAPRLAETVIPVEWVESKRTREKTRATLQAAKEAFEAERCVVMFPAGRLARRADDGQLTDPPWQITAVSLARKYAAPVSPVHVSGPESRLFHTFDRVSEELRDITLFHELLNKRGRRFQLTVGPLIPPHRLDVDAAKATYSLKAYVERVLANQPDAEFA